ncbi:hypothetical protein PR048_030541 [Dryococelus australis]|uniref:Uncharacterized protein n=1 Tax=Dryococelus australis TaxID=614101 RepID=A0ABQ9G989_9NEOP|nr:hypothetical protein PR048_030541 [Dryococelus australis]
MRMIEVSMEQSPNERAGGNGRSPRKLADRRHGPARFTGVEIRGGGGGGQPGRHRLGGYPDKADVSCLYSPLQQYQLCLRGEIWAALNTEVSRADGGEARRVWSSAGMQGRGMPDKKTRRPAASSATIPTCENPGVTLPGIKPGSPRWLASSLTTTPPQPYCRFRLSLYFHLLTYYWLWLHPSKSFPFKRSPECIHRVSMTILVAVCNDFVFESHCGNTALHSTEGNFGHAARSRAGSNCGSTARSSLGEIETVQNLVWDLPRKIGRVQLPNLVRNLAIQGGKCHDGCHTSPYTGRYGGPCSNFYGIWYRVTAILLTTVATRHTPVPGEIVATRCALILAVTVAVRRSSHGKPVLMPESHSFDKQDTTIISQQPIRYTTLLTPTRRKSSHNTAVFGKETFSMFVLSPSTEINVENVAGSLSFQPRAQETRAAKAWHLLHIFALLRRHQERHIAGEGEQRSAGHPGATSCGGESAGPRVKADAIASKFLCYSIPFLTHLQATARRIQQWSGSLFNSSITLLLVLAAAVVSLQGIPLTTIVAARRAHIVTATILVTVVVGRVAVIFAAIVAVQSVITLTATEVLWPPVRTANVATRKDNLLSTPRPAGPLGDKCCGKLDKNARRGRGGSVKGEDKRHWRMAQPADPRAVSHGWTLSMARLDGWLADNSVTVAKSPLLSRSGEESWV